MLASKFSNIHCRMWKCLTGDSAAPEDIHELLQFLGNLLLYPSALGTGQTLVAKEDVTCILDECFPSLDPRMLSHNGYLCLKAFITEVRVSTSSGCTRQRAAAGLPFYKDRRR